MVKKYKYIIIPILIFIIIKLISMGCVAPKAVEITPKIATIENRMDKLETILDNKIDAKVLAGTIDNFKQEIKQSLINGEFTKTVEGNENHGGAGWVVLGTAAMAVIFLGAILLVIKLFLNSRKKDNLLRLLATSVKNTDKNTSRKIKNQIEYEVANGGGFCFKDKKELAKFVTKHGIFATDKQHKK